MADTYLDSSVIGFNHQDALDTRVDTYKRLAPILNAVDSPAIDSSFADNLHQNVIDASDGISQKVSDAPKIDMGAALVSTDPVIKANAQRASYEQLEKNPETKFGLGRTIETPKSAYTDKFNSKEFGFSALRNNEDFYYNNDYMRDGWFTRNLVKNPVRFLGRVAVPAILKIGEGLGNVGSMLTSIGSNNYWADVADNGFSRWFENLETDFKDQIAPVYKKAGFDEKGFFSKMVDWSFWNESIADGVAFMASAALPGMGLAKIGTLGSFGEAFGAAARVGSIANRAGKVAGMAGLGSWAELTSWGFNTAMEASMEGAGVYKELSRRMKEGRDNGDPAYADLTDDDIKERAGRMAGNTVGGNFLILGVSNAFENTLFFKPFKNIEGRASLHLGEDFKAASNAVNYVEGTGGSFANSGLTRGVYYGKQAVAGTLMEGLWEENAQLALQRKEQGDTQGRGFWAQLGKQTLDAFAGKDQEASESIGLGALIGIGAGVLLSKASGERREIIENTKKAIEYAEVARQKLFDNNDIYHRDADNKIVFEGNEPKVDPVKLATKQKALETEFGNISLANKDEFLKSQNVQFDVKRSLANYVRSLNNVGVTGVSDRLKNLNPETASLFGLDPAKTNEGVAALADMARNFEDVSKETDKLALGKRPEGVSQKDFADNHEDRKAEVYKALSSNAILTDFVKDNNSKLLASINAFRSLSNASLSEFPVDQLNTLIAQKKFNEEAMKSKNYQDDIPDIIKKYHEDRNKELEDDIAKYKADYGLALTDSKLTSGGFYTPTVKQADGTVKEVAFDKRSAELQRKIADYNNIIHKNEFVAGLLSDQDKWHENLEKLRDTPAMRKMKDALKAAATEAAKPSAVTEAQKKYRELVPGDFDKLNLLVAKMAFSEDRNFTPEELQLQQNYSELVEKMIGEYQEIADEQTSKILADKLRSRLKVLESVGNFIKKGIQGIEDAKTEIEILREELAHEANKKRADQKRIKDAIKSLESKVETAEKRVAEEEANYIKLNEFVKELEGQIAENNYKGLTDAFNALKEQRDWNGALLDEQRDILKSVKELLSMLVRAAGRIFGKGWRNNFTSAYDDGINYVEEITNAEDRKAAATEAIQQLEKTQAELDSAYDNSVKDVTAINDSIAKYFRDKYQDTTKAKPIPVDNEDLEISQGLGSESAGQSSEGSNYDEEAGFDGATYQRPLNTKFFTSTFPRIEGNLKDQPKDVQDYFEFVDFVTNPANAKVLKEKLGKGTLKVLSVTKNNVVALGLGDTLKDRQEPFKINDPALTHVELIPVIEEGGYQYYVDAKLNRLGRVNSENDIKKVEEVKNFVNGLTNMVGLGGWAGATEFVRDTLKIDLKDPDALGKAKAAIKKLGPTKVEKAPKDIIRRSLRRAVFTDAETPQYLKKYKQADLDKAIKAGTDWRKSLLADTASNPIHISDATITRGIPNKMIMQDGQQARNPVIGTLLPEDQVNGQTVRVSSTVNPNFTINGQNIEVPPGRPFIYTTNGVHEQLHAADNQKLDDEQVKNVGGVLKALLKDHIAKVEERIAKSTSFPQNLKDAIAKAGSINNLDPLTKKQVFLAVTKDPSTKGFKLMNSSYEQYLQSIIHYLGANLKDKDGKDRNRSEKTVFIVGYNMRFGTKGPVVDITDANAIDKPEIQDFLKGLFHNVKYFTDTAKAEAPYVEYYLDKDNKLVTRTWKNYSTYLLSEKTPEGKNRTSIPITTSIKTLEQHKAEKTTDPYYPYVSRGITLDVKKPAIKKSAPKAKEEFEEVPTDASSIENLFIQGVLGMYPQQAQNQTSIPKKEAEPKKESAPKGKPKEEFDPAAPITGELVGALFNQFYGNTGDPTAGTVANFSNDFVSQDDDEDIDLGAFEPATLPRTEAPSKAAPDTELPISGMFRVATSGFFNVEKDLDATISEIKRMIPQFNVERLKKAIQVTSDIQAWGQFVDDTIKLYELAEEGTGYHEVFEAVANKLLTNREWNAMAKEFRARNGYFTDRETTQRVRYADATAHQVKEQLAEEFKDYKLGKSTPAQPNTKSFLRMIWDFVKSFFTNRNTIDQIFSRIEEGKFAQRGVRSENRFSSNFRLLTKVPVEVRQDLLEGATAFLFQHVFFSPKSLTAFDAEGEIDSALYEPIKAKFIQTQNVLKNKYSAENDEAAKANYMLAINHIQYALDNWTTEFVPAHKEFLKPFKLRFEEVDLEKSADKDDTQNRNDYLSDVFKIDGKKSASKSVRFLMGTLLRLNFDKEGKTNVVNGKTVGALAPRTSSVFMASLADYDTYMLKALEELQGLNDFTRVEAKLRELSGIREIEEMQNPEAQAKLIASLPEDKAVWTSLYMKLFGTFPNVSEEASYNLKVKFFNYISKHSPEPYVFIHGGSTSTIISSTKRGFFETIMRRIEGSLLVNNALIFNKVKNKEGNTVYEPKPEFRTPITVDEFTSKKVAAFIDFLGLKDYINNDLVKNLSKNEKAELMRHLVSIRNSLTNVSAPTINVKQLNIFGYTEELIEFLDKKLDVSKREGSFLNIENQSQQRHIIPSFISRLISEINNVTTLKELNEKFPQTATLWANDSLLLAKLFDKDGNRTSHPISLGYMEGIKDVDENEGDKSAKLEFVDKYYLQFNASLSGLYYSLPADSETEWVFNFGEFVNFSENMMQDRGDAIVRENFVPKLLTEITLARKGSDLMQLNAKHPTLDRKIGNSLRFFKDILANDKTLVKEIHAEIDEKDPKKIKTPEQIVGDKKYKKRIETAIKNWIMAEVANTTATLKEGGILRELQHENAPSDFWIGGLNSKFTDKYSNAFSIDQGMAKLSASQLSSLIQYQKINSVLGEWETFKIAFGDPAQYKDWEKRAKSLFGPVEQNYYDETGELNSWLTANKNTAVVDGEEAAIAPTDIFYQEFSDKVNARTIDDFKVVNVQTHNDLSTLAEEDEKLRPFINRFINAYAETEESDGQSIGTLPFARHLMIKAGWRWSDEHEAYFQYDTALMRQELSKDGRYNYNGNKALQELDKKIIAKYSKEEPMAALSPVKTLMPFVDADGNQHLFKHSIHFMSYQVAKEFELLDVYLDSLKRKDSILNFKSVQKIGLQGDKNGKITSYYKSPFEKNDLEAAENPVISVDMKTIGIQVETQTSGKGQTLGSQLTKLSNLNILENGIPVDYQVEGLNASQTLEKWDSLSEEEKLAASPKYRLVNGESGTVKSLENLKMKNSLDTFNSLGIKWKFDSAGNLSYDVKDLSRIRDYIHNELRRLTVDDNTIDNIALTEDYQRFVNPAETVPSYTTISNLLWSMADKAVTSMKVNGKPYIQVSSSFFNKSSRKAAYKTKDRNVNLKDLRKKYSQELIQFVWNRLASEGIDNADDLIGTRETIENTDAHKFWENVTNKDIQNLINAYQENKQKQLDEFKAFGKEDFNPQTGNIVNNDTSWWDDKIRDAEDILRNSEVALGKWVTLNNKEEYDAAVAAGHKPVMTSSELKFYSLKRDENGVPVETEAMEIYLPHIYKSKINKKRKLLDFPPLSDQQLMDHLNKNPKLLEGIGFRIPTQATSSLEFFKIKGFLPEAFGSAVVVPSGITTKAGSDFDVDKLNTYLNNFKLGKDGLPFYEEFKDDNNSTVEERYGTFVRSQERSFRTIYNEMRANAQYQGRDVDELIDANLSDLDTAKDLKDLGVKEAEAAYNEGYRIFTNLPYAIKYQYFDQEKKLRNLEIDGTEKALEYLAYTNKWIAAFDNDDTQLSLDVVNKEGKVHSEKVIGREALPVLHEMAANYTDFLQKNGIADELIKEYLDTKKEKLGENREVLNKVKVAIAKAVAQKMNLPSMQEFQALPIALQNTKGAVENRYFESIRNILKQPDMFAYLLSPNSVQHIKDMRDEVQRAIDPNWQSDDKKEINYTNFLSTEYLARKRNEFTKGKYDIGIFAVAMTNFANTQVTGIGITSLGGVKKTDKHIFFDLNDGYINLPFKDLKMLKRTISVNNGAFWESKDVLMIPISTLQDSEGELTMDKLSAYINGAVDVAKDPIIVEMGMHTELAGSYTLMERMGLTGKTTSLFLYQPAIRDFLKELIAKKTYFSENNPLPMKKIIEGILDSYPGGEKVYDPNFKFTDDQLRDMITKGEQIRKTGKGSFTAEENYAQRMALINFLKIRMFAQHLLETIQGSNHDTASVRSPYIITKKDLLLARSKTGNVIGKIANGQIKNGTERLREETSIKTDVGMLKQFNSLFSKIGLFALQREHPQRTLKAIAERVFKEAGGFISDDDFITNMREAESSMLNSLINQVGINTEVNGEVVTNELWKYARDYFKTGRRNSLKNRLDNIKRNPNYANYIRNNYFLKNLEINSDQNYGVDIMELKSKPSNSDVLTREKITQGMLSLAQLDEKRFPDLVQFYRAVVYGSLIQNGIKFSRKSFVDLIPVSTSASDPNAPLSITDITRPALEDIDIEDFSMLDEQIQRTRWNNKKVVPEKRQYSMRFLVPDAKGKFTLEGKSRWRQGKSKPPAKGSQTFFGRVDDKGVVQPSIHPAFFYAGMGEEAKKWEEMENIINVPAVKPEFLMKTYNDGHEEYRTTPIVEKMKKRGDYSYLYNQLYKKVGLEDPSMGRGMVTKNDKGGKVVTYLYKPINKYGFRDFSEVQPLKRNDDGTVTGNPSILDFPPFKELTDAEIINNTIDTKGLIIPVISPEVLTNTVNRKPVANRMIKPTKIKKDEGKTDIGYNFDFPTIEPQC